jgi:hypothetical protein
MNLSGHTQNPAYTIATLGRHGILRSVHLRFYAFVWYFSFSYFYFIRSMMHQLGHIARAVMERPWCLGVMGFLLVFVPILGMWAVHKYGWEHWEPFSRHEPPTPPTE